MKILFWLITVLLVLVLLAAAYFGLTEVFGLLPEAHRPLEVLAVATEFLYGLLALIALVGMATHHRTTPIVLVAWAVAATAGSALSPVTWGRAPAVEGIKSRIVVGLVVGALVFGWRYTRRQLPGSSPPEAA